MANYDVTLEVTPTPSAEVQIETDPGSGVSANNAEAWAVGKRHGVDVESTDITYHNNSKYYAQQASGAEQAAQDAEAAKQAAQAAVAHYPYVDTTTGNWMCWDTATSAWVNTGVHAQGPTGTVPDLTVGTVTTLAPGSSATVTRRSGSPDEAPVFDFGIPKGDTGSVTNVYGSTIPMSDTDSTKVKAAIDGKTDKVGSATNNNFAALDASGNLKDSGHKHSDYLTQHQDISGKADKVSGATNNNFAALDANGNLKDSGKKASDFAEAAAGLPTGGSTGYYLVKTGSGNYAVAWCSPDTVPIPTSPRLITSDAVATVDAKATLALNSIASEYDPTATYKKGGLIFYESGGTVSLMRCKGTTTGSFDLTKWEVADIGEAIQSVQESVEALIDDTAGAGDTDVTLSADKIMDELGDRDTDIGNVAAGLAIVVTGDTAPANIDSWAYIFLKGHSTLATGGYHATAAISSGDTISSSNVAADSDGIANALNSNLLKWTKIKQSTNPGTVDISGYREILVNGRFTDITTTISIYIVCDVLTQTGVYYRANNPNDSGVGYAYFKATNTQLNDFASYTGISPVVKNCEWTIYGRK